MTLRVALLGPVLVERDGAAIPLPTRQSARLLTLLAAAPDARVATPALIDGIWGGAPPQTAANTLQVHVSTLRRVIGRELVVTEPGGYRLAVPPEDVDEWVFLRHLDDAAAAQRDGHLGAARDAYRRALSLWRGEPFSDVRGPGLAARRDRLIDLADSAAEELLACRLDLSRDAGELSTVVADAHALVAAAPLRERRRALLVRGLAAAGRPAESTEAYLQAVATLRDDLGLDPGPELREAHAAALRQDPAVLPRAWRAADRVPAALSPLIDRETELAQVRAALLDPHVRLVTLTGPPGSGKTRLAIAAAAAHRDDAVGGVVVVELRRSGDAGVAEAVAAALGTPVDGEGGAETGWGPGPALLVLDDVGRPGDAGEVVAYLRGHPRLTVLATGPRQLAVAGERVVPVTGLELPDSDTDPDAWQAPAVALFVARAREAGARISPDDLGDVVALCRRLDGLPLALELVAAQAAETSLAELARRDTLDLVGTRRYDDSGRLRSLLDAIDESLSLLDDDSRALFRAAGEVPSGVTLDLAAGLLGSADRGAAAMARLLESHLAEPSDGSRQPRVRLSDTLAARARDLLTGTEQDRVRATVRATLARARRELVPGPDPYPVGLAAREQQLAELDTLRAGLRWPDGWADPDERADVALLYASATLQRGEHARGRPWLESALAQAGLSPDRGVDLRLALAAIATVVGRPEEAGSWLERAREAAAGDPDRLRAVLVRSSLAAVRDQRSEAAADLLAESAVLGGPAGTSALADRPGPELCEDLVALRAARLVGSEPVNGSSADDGMSADVELLTAVEDLPSTHARAELLADLAIRLARSGPTDAADRAARLLSTAVDDWGGDELRADVVLTEALLAQRHGDAMTAARRAEEAAASYRTVGARHRLALASDVSRTARGDRPEAEGTAPSPEAVTDADPDR